MIPINPVESMATTNAKQVENKQKQRQRKRKRRKRKTKKKIRKDEEATDRSFIPGRDKSFFNVTWKSCVNLSLILVTLLGHTTSEMD